MRGVSPTTAQGTSWTPPLAEVCFRSSQWGVSEPETVVQWNVWLCTCGLQTWSHSLSSIPVWHSLPAVDVSLWCPDSVCYKIWLFAILGHNGCTAAYSGASLVLRQYRKWWNSVCNNCFNYNNLYWVKLWVIWINSDFEFKYIRLIIRYWFCSTIHYWGDEIYSRARLQVLATGWVSPTVLRERSLEGKTHVDRYEQYQSFSVNYRQYCHFRFDIFALIIEIIRVKYVRL